MNHPSPHTLPFITPHPFTTTTPPTPHPHPPSTTTVNHHMHGGVRLELTSTTTSPLAIDVSESTEMRIQRLVTENPVIIFSRSGCCMCHVMRHLLTSLGVHPTVIELEEEEIGALSELRNDGGGEAETVAPAVFIGGESVGGLESLVGLHLSGQLVPKLVESGVLVL